MEATFKFRFGSKPNLLPSLSQQLDRKMKSFILRGNFLFRVISRKEIVIKPSNPGGVENQMQVYHVALPIGYQISCPLLSVLCFCVVCNEAVEQRTTVTWLLEGSVHLQDKSRAPQRGARRDGAPKPSRSRCCFALEFRALMCHAVFALSL